MGKIELDKRRVHIRINSCCNNNCTFCCDRVLPGGKLGLFNQNANQHKGHFLTIEGFKKASEKTNNINSILFTGGEPTLNKNLVFFVKLAKEKRYKNIAIQTNGRLLCYNDFCIELLENGVSEINISIHGSNRKIHDALTRCPGAFEQAYQGLCNVVALKKRYQFKINTNFTITKLNYKDIYNYLKMLLLFKKIDSIVLNTLMYTGNAKRFLNQLFISYTDIAEEVKKAVDKLKKNGVSNYSSIQLSPMPFCLMLGYEDYVGRFETALQIQNKKAEILFRDNDQIKNDKCRGCKFYYVCSGIDNVYVKKIGWSELTLVSS